MIPATTISRHGRARLGLELSSRYLQSRVGDLARLAVPAAVLAVGLALARFSHSGSAETVYLTTLATGILAVVAALAPRPALELMTGAGLMALALVVIPPGPTRGLGVVMVLTATLALAAARNLARGRDLTLATAAALAVGVQLLLRSDRLLGLEADLHTAAWLLVLPVLAALALTLLAGGHGRGRALVAAAAVAPLVPGWGVTSTLALLALAAGEVLRRPRVLAESQAARLAVRAGAGLAAAAPLLWEPGTGAPATAAALSLALMPEAGGRRRWLPLLPALIALVATPLFPARSWPEALALVAWLPLLLPALAAVAPDRLPLAGAAGLLALAAARGEPLLSGPSPLLAAPLALAALALPSREAGDPGNVEKRWQRAAAGLQGAWSATLLGVATLAAAYPWLRETPLEEVVRCFLPGTGWGSAAVLGLGMTLLALAAARWRLWGHRLLAAGAIVLLATLLLHLPPPPVVSEHPAGSVILDAEQPDWRLELPGARVASVTLDTSLAFAATLPPGTPVATVRLEDGSGRQVDWSLTAGEGTGEWAALRRDVAARPGFRAPPPWLSEVASEGGFFARRYRTRFDLDAIHPTDPRQAMSLTVQRRADLPPQVTLAIFHAEVR